MPYLETVEPHTLAILKKIQALSELRATRLVGGTALALHLGHRHSIDLDFFGNWEVESLEPFLASCGSVIRTGGKKNLQFYSVDQVKCDFVRYKYQWLKPPIEVDSLRLAHIDDIAAMKLKAITGRGSKKDFIDLVFLLDHYTLSEMLTLYRNKYPDGSEYMVLRSLVYFDDAEEDPMPQMLKPLQWDEAKERIQAAVRAYACA